MWPEGLERGAYSVGSGALIGPWVCGRMETVVGGRRHTGVDVRIRVWVTTVATCSTDRWDEHPATSAKSANAKEGMSNIRLTRRALLVEPS